MPHSTLLTVHERRSLCERTVNGELPCTLDGRPAIIAAYLLPYPVVLSRDGKLRGEWSWDAVARILLTRDGKFEL